MSKHFQAINPQTEEALDGQFNTATEADINHKVEEAHKAFEQYRNINPSRKADFLDSIADEIEALGEALIERCHLETGLPEGRLTGERGRTVGQLRLFATVLREGSWVDARIDTAIPDRKPMPRSDIRHMSVPLGPVAIFGASNFPLAFSTAGGDTASALAAGCTVVVKGHPAHPGTTEFINQAIQTAITKSGMPLGVFNIVQGNTIEVGQTLVTHPLIKAVGFTGSYKGGKAIFDAANQRPEPIPVFAEMGSSNPVFILPEAMAAKGEQLAYGLAGSINLGVGQFCTNPGLVFTPETEALVPFKKHLTTAISNVEQSSMLTGGIKSAYDKGLNLYEDQIGIKPLAESKEVASGVKSKVYETDIKTYLKNEILEDENFGPSSILVTAENKEDILKVARSLQGHLTATVHGTEADLETYRNLIEILQSKVGRIVINGFPTGVEVCHAMVHGGPFPATTAPQSTSVGTNAIKRFVRPLCYQDFPASLLPDALQNDNPLHIWRLVNGELTKNKI